MIKIKVLLIAILLTKIVQNVCPSECSSCNSSKYSRWWQYSEGLARQQCTSCNSITNLTPNLPYCRCDNGYFYNAYECVQHKVGTIYKDDFEGTLDNWVKGPAKSFISITQTTDENWDGNVATFTNNQYGGDAFYKYSFQSLKYSERVWLSFDYKDNMPLSDCLNMGWGNSQQNPGSHNWQIVGCTTSVTHYQIYDKTDQDGTWQHFEALIEVYYEEVANFFVQNPTVNGRNVIKFDNFEISSVHGPSGLLFSPYSLNQPTIQIMSVSFDGYGGELTLQQFNFWISEMDTILGNNTWDSQQFAVYIQGEQETVEVILYRSNNGIELGDAYGRFVDNTPYTSKRYFNAGDYLIFDENKTPNKDDFVLKNGNGDYLGPYKFPDSYLQTCFDHCIDYETFAEATQKCSENVQCDGIRFTHKLWGGIKSQGFNSLNGYGYQLRRSQKEDASNMVNIGKRPREFSYHKNQPSKYQNTADGAFCHYSCSSCGSTNIWQNIFENENMDIKQCSTCNLDLNDPNRNTSGDCSCKPGYFDDGNLCQQHKIGIIYEDNFADSNWIDNWQPKFERSSISLTTKYSKNCINFNSAQTGSDIIYKKQYQNIPYSKAYIILEYVDEGNTEFYFGVGNSYPGDYTFTDASSSLNDSTKRSIPQTSGSCWGYLEASIDIDHNVPYSFIVQDSAANKGLYISSFKLVSGHGPSTINKSGYTYIQPGIQILSIDYTGFDNSATAIQQFNFNKQDLQDAIGRPPVNEETLAVYIEGQKVIAEIKIYLDQNNGQSLGDSYGRFVNNNDYTGTQHFKVGEWLIFDQNLSQNKNDFELKTGTCSFDGPLKHQDQNLETCFNDCQDFQTLGEAMQECLLQTNCDGVTFSHFSWGGANSVGFLDGYGFQLRKTGTTPTRDHPRDFEHSWKKNIKKYTYQQGTQLECTSCPKECEYCNSDGTCSTCFDSTRENPPTCSCINGLLEMDDYQYCGCNIKCATCQGTINDCLTCNGSNRNISNDCQCDVNYYQEENNPVCQACQHPCIDCESLTICKSCVAGSNRNPFPTCTCEEGYYEDGSQNCVKCDNKCKTCTGQGDTCDICSDLTRENAPQCSCIEGYYDNNEISCLKCHKKCKSCNTTNETCNICNTQRFNPPQCPCVQGYYEGVNFECTKCKDTCTICSALDNCSSCSSNLRTPPFCNCIIGYYQNQETNNCEKCDLKCLSCNTKSNQCQICQLGKGRTLEPPYCGCKQGYYEDENELNCKQCNEYCQECIDDTICTVCLNPDANLPFCKTSKSERASMVIIEDGVYVEKQCDIQCGSCETSQNNCISCIKGINRSQEPPTCECKQGYHDDNGLLKYCIKCHPSCLACKDGNLCTTCQDGLILNEFSGNCECPYGKILKNNQCIKCYYFNNQCLIKCPQQTFTDEKLQTCISQQQQEQSSINIIYICGGLIVLVLLLNIVFIINLVHRKSKNFKLKQPQYSTIQKKNNKTNQENNSNEEQA